MRPATLRVGMSTCGLAAGAGAAHRALTREIALRELPLRLEGTGCLGACHREPLVEVLDGAGAVLYGPITEEAVGPLLDHLSGAGAPVPEDRVVSRRGDRSDYPFLGRQQKLTTQLCGVIDPHSLDAYLAHGGYEALRQARRTPPEQVVEAVKASRLRGRGGAGFPTGAKWEISRAQRRRPKYVVCNADEGDPGAFMDRTLIEGDPHRVIEGMLIGAWATGATGAYVYIRAEYPLAVAALQEAIGQARELGVVGRDVFGTGTPFEIVVKEGAGAFVCGEETALMRSIEGHRGMPTMRPPYPSEHGLWGHPTTINNVETFAAVPSIMLEGPGWFAAMGTERCGGTKAFALAGAIERSGLVEVPMGMTLREMVYEIGGGCRGGRAFKAVQLGGPSGGCVPAGLLDTRIDYEDLRATGAIMGSGGMVVADETNCMVDLARFFLAFTQDESCGKCVPCRVGARKMLDLLTAATQGRAAPGDLRRLESLCRTVEAASLCGLGQTAPNPVRTTLRYFPEEYAAHMEERRCPAGVCPMSGGQEAA
ncbi:MAG: NADH-quinone oxidoreductase subunit F [Actinobacteria bacterium]|nr:NADH-quinone oxidoreductase subunit F [Actinomycetota bacterium]